MDIPTYSRKWLYYIRLSDFWMTILEILFLSKEKATASIWIGATFFLHIRSLQSFSKAGTYSIALCIIMKRNNEKFWKHKDAEIHFCLICAFPTRWHISAHIKSLLTLPSIFRIKDAFHLSRVYPRGSLVIALVR